MTATALAPESKYQLTIVPHYTEEQLISSLYNKDKEAFSYLYDSYSPALFTVICRQISNRTLCEDILQEVFIKIWKNFSSFDSKKGRLYTWMVSLTKNLLIDTLRSRHYRQQLKTDAGHSDLKSNDDCEFSKFDALRIHSFLRVLSQDEVKLIELAYYHGMTQSEISKEISMPLGTIKTKMRNALIKLREAAKDDEIKKPMLTPCL